MDPLPDRPRLIDLACRLGCDKSTVSLALRDDARISSATRKRVRALAEEMGYRPDPASRRLATRRWQGVHGEKPMSLALLAGRRADYKAQRATVLAIARSVAPELGYGFEEIFLEDYPRRGQAAAVMEARGVAGVLMMASSHGEAYTNFPVERFSTVRIETGGSSLPGGAIFRHDAFGNLQEAGWRVRAAGFASAAVLLIAQSQPSETDVRHDAAGRWLEAFWRKAGIRSWKPQWFRAGGHEERMVAWIQRNKPAVVIAQNSGLDPALRKAGLIVGRDLRGITLSRRGGRDWAGYEVRLEVITRRALEHLDLLVRRDQKTDPERPEVTVVPGRWVDGESFSGVSSLPPGGTKT